MGTAISVSNLKKHFQVKKKEPGIIGSLSSLISPLYENVKAVDDISFTIKEGELLGTAVNIVAMVFGNMGDDSGTGVCFTRDPNTGEKVHYG